MCPLCGWSIGTACSSVEQAVLCELNWENRRKYELRYKDRETPVLVRSIRYQGADGKGDSSERLEAVNVEQARLQIGGGRAGAVAHVAASGGGGAKLAGLPDGDLRRDGRR